MASSNDAKQWAQTRELVKDLTTYHDTNDEAKARRPQNIALALSAMELMEKAGLKPPIAVLACYTGSVDLHWSGANGGVTCDFGIDPEDPDSDVTLCTSVAKSDPKCVFLPYSTGNKEQGEELVRVLSLRLGELHQNPKTPSMASSSPSESKDQEQRQQLESETFTFRTADLVQFWADDVEPLRTTFITTFITADPIRRMWRRLLSIDDHNDDGTCKELEALVKAVELQVTLTHAQRQKSVRRSLVIVDAQTNASVFSCYSSTPSTDILPPLLRILVRCKLCVHTAKLQ